MQMDLELDIVDSLQALRFQGACLEQRSLSKAVDEGMGSGELREVLFWLATELHVLRKTDERVTSSSTDHDEFAFELSLLLTELQCPYRQLVIGPISERFKKRESLLHLLEYLTSELMATKMSLKRRRSLEPPAKKSKTESNIQQKVIELSRDLHLGQDLPNNLNTKMLFEKFTPRLEQLLKQTNPKLVSEPLLDPNKPLGDDQWRVLEAMHKDLDSEYNLRRQMMLTRLEATVQSFQWSESMHHREKEIMDLFESKLKELEELKFGGDDTNLVALLAARKDLAIIEKTSSAQVRKNTASKIQKHVMGRVPDRGGRANEHAPPPPEMPSWQQQRASGPPGGGGRGGGGGAGGRGGGGNFRGGRGGGGGNWHQENPQQHRDRGAGGNWQQENPQQQRDRDQQWIGGSGRVQGTGWSNYERGGGRGGGGGGRGGGGYHQRGGYR